MLTRKRIGLLLGILGCCIPLVMQFDGLTTAGHLALSIALLAACFWIFEPIPIYSTSVLVILLGAVLLSGQGPVYQTAAVPSSYRESRAGHLL